MFGSSQLVIVRSAPCRTFTRGLCGCEDDTARAPVHPFFEGEVTHCHPPRYYEPWTGRFVSEDPALDGANWFAYCGNEPVATIDPSGLSFILDVLLADLTAFLNRMASGAAAQAARGWASNKIANVWAERLGYIFGLAVSMEMEAMGKSFINYGAGGQHDTFKFSNNNNMNVHHGGGHYGKPHVDLRGSVFRDVERMFSGYGGIPLGAFMRGFWRGFF